MKLARKRWSGALILLLALVVAACGGGNAGGGTAGGSGGTGGGSGSSGGGSSGSGRSGAGSAKRVQIEHWHTYSDGEEAVLLNEIKPLFEEQHPNIELVPVRMPYEGLKQQVIAGVAGDAAPDLMRMDIIWVPEFAKMGALMRLDNKDGFAAVKDSVFDGPLATNYYDGGYYGLPLNTNTKVAIYNKAILDDLGIQPPKTMDELADAARQAKAKGYPGGITRTITASTAWISFFMTFSTDIRKEPFHYHDHAFSDSWRLSAGSVETWPVNGKLSFSFQPCKKTRMASSGCQPDETAERTGHFGFFWFHCVSSDSASFGMYLKISPVSSASMRRVSHR